MYEVLKKGRVHNLSIQCQYDLFDKMVNGKDSKLSLILYYKYMYIEILHGQYQSSWFNSVKSILDNCGFSNIWECQGIFILHG